MSHKKKICNTALATHIETCHPAFTYTPLVVNRHHWPDYDKPEPRGLPAAINAEIDQVVEPQFSKSMADLPCAEEVSQKLMNGNSALMKDLRKQMPDIDEKLIATINNVVDTARVEREVTLSTEIFDAAIEEVGEAANLADPVAAIRAREQKILADIDFEKIGEAKLESFPRWTSYELPELGIFFTESVCYRCEGTTVAPCGEEFTLLPGDAIKESWKQSESQTDQNDDSVATSNNTTATTTADNSQTLTQSFDNTVKRETDVNLALEASLSGKLFKVLSGKLDGKASYDFNKIVSNVSKSTSEDKRSFMHKVVRNLKTSTTSSRSQTRTMSTSSSYDRNLVNNSDKPRHFIERQQHCVYSVHHKRVNAQLG